MGENETEKVDLKDDDGIERLLIEITITMFGEPAIS